jgi:hypothetical protein
MEYVYETPQRAQEDMDKWAVPANGVHAVGNGLTIRSSIITDLHYHTEDATH